MGDATDMIMEGILCEVCGVIMDDAIGESEPPGFPRSCEYCEEQ